MFSRMVDCTVHPEQKQEFRTTLTNQVVPVLKAQPGFLDLLTLVSDEHPDRALLISVWQCREDADRFYTHQAPVVEILRSFFARQPTVEHFHLETSAPFQVARGKAA